MRIRSIKPDFYKDEDVSECSIWARYLFPGLWCMADSEGRMKDSPKRIKAEVLPYDDVEVGALLDELASHGLIVRYMVDGAGYIAIPGFPTHQRITGKEAMTPSRYPAPDGETTGKQWGNAGEGLDSLEGKGREGKGKETVVPVCDPAYSHLASADYLRNLTQAVISADPSPALLSRWKAAIHDRAAVKTPPEVIDAAMRWYETAGKFRPKWPEEKWLSGEWIATVIAAHRKAEPPTNPDDEMSDELKKFLLAPPPDFR